MMHGHCYYERFMLELPEHKGKYPSYKRYAKSTIVEAARRASGLEDKS